MADYLVTDTELTSIANAIRERGGTNASLEFPSGYVSAIQNLPIGAIAVEETTDANGGTVKNIIGGINISNDTVTAAALRTGYTAHTSSGEAITGTLVTGDEDVLFIDYDGTELYGYSKAEFLALTEMPPNPTHTGLTAQGWNWTLADAKEYVTACNMLVIGQHYVTDDGKTRVYLDVKATLHSIFKFSQTVANGVTVNWGDGSAEETLSGTGSKTIEHNYSNSGQYVVTFNVTSGTMVMGQGTTATSFYGHYTDNRAEGSQIKKIEIGSNVTKLHSACLQYCPSIETITMPYNIDIGAAPLNGCYKFKCFIEPSGITGTNTARAFSYAYGLKYASLPKSHTTINESLFETCYNLRRIHFPLGATVIPRAVCYNCRNLKYVTYSTSITTINDSAFGTCMALRYVTPLPSTLTTIGSAAFGDCCYAFDSVIIPSNVTTLTNAFYDTKSLRSITIPNTVTSIATSAFGYCCSLSEIEFPSSVTSLGEKIFYNCSLLQHVDIKGNITEIPNQCFYNCAAISVFSCPATVTSISTNAFQNCYSLIVVIMNPTTPPTLESDSFTNCYKLNYIYVPYGCGDAYKAATNWSTYASKIYEMPQS